MSASPRSAARDMDAVPADAGLKQELSAFKRRRIREEAAHLFFRQGYERSSIDAIAERLQVTKPFIYTHYRNKGEILFDISRLGISLSLEVLDQCLAKKGGSWDRLKLIIERVTRVILEHQESIVVYVREEKNLEAASARAIRQQRSLFDHRLAELLREGSREGVLEAADPGLTAVTISGMMSFIAFWYVPGGRWSESEITSNLIHNVRRMVQPVPTAG